MNDSAKETHRAVRERSSALSATLLSEADFVAEPVERLDLPEPPTRAERRFHVVALIAAAVLHILIPLSFFLYYWLWPHTSSDRRAGDSGRGGGRAAPAASAQAEAAGGETEAPAASPDRKARL